MRSSIDNRGLRAEATNLRERAQVYSKMCGIEGKAKAEARNLTANESQAFEQLDRKHSDLDARILEIENQLGDHDRERMTRSVAIPRAGPARRR